MPGKVDIAFGRDSEVDGIGHDLFCEVAVDFIDFDAFSDVDGFDIGESFFFG